MSDNEKSADKSSEVPQITTVSGLKEFLLSIRDRMADRSAAPIYGLSALNHVMKMSGVQDLLDQENKEIARDIWLHLKQSGFQLKNPPLLFGPEEEAEAGSRPNP